MHTVKEKRLRCSPAPVGMLIAGICLVDYIVAVLQRVFCMFYFAALTDFGASQCLLSVRWQRANSY